jgi:hypothetical protein
MPEEEEEEQPQGRTTKARGRRGAGGGRFLPVLARGAPLPPVPGAYRVAAGATTSAAAASPGPSYDGNGNGENSSMHGSEGPGTEPILPPPPPVEAPAAVLVEAEVVVPPELVEATRVLHPEKTADPDPRRKIPRSGALIVAGVVLLAAAVVGITFGVALKVPSPSSPTQTTSAGAGPSAAPTLGGGDGWAETFIDDRLDLAPQDCQDEAVAFGYCVDAFTGGNSAACTVCVLGQDRGGTCQTKEFLSCNLLTLCPSCGQCQEEWLVLWNCLTPDYCENFKCDSTSSPSSQAPGPSGAAPSTTAP